MIFLILYYYNNVLESYIHTESVSTWHWVTTSIKTSVENRTLTNLRITILVIWRNSEEVRNCQVYTSALKQKLL